MSRFILSAMIVAGCLSGCATTSLKSALGTPKNPTVILSNPDAQKAGDQYTFISADYRVLLMSIDKITGTTRLGPIAPNEMRHYLGSGYHLADVYCASYFAKTDEAYRRRRYGRTLTNDVGTAVTTIMGLAKAGESVVTALAAATGFADSAWRNYDDSFVISPELANVRTLVLAAQDNFRARTLTKDEGLPRDFGTAQSSIERYAGLCSYLGMKSLLDQSATEQQRALKAETTAITTPDKPAPGAPAAAPAKQPPVAEVAVAPPATATPPLANNKQD